MNKVVVRLILCLFAALVCAAPAQAQTHTLSGTVFGGGSGLAGAAVAALQDGTTTVLAGTTTGASGQYALTLADGTYDLRVTPAAGSGFGQETIQDVVISGADRTYDIILLADSGGLKGTVRGYGGAAVASASISVYTPNWQAIASTTTDAAGKYSVSLGSGSVILYVQAPWPPSGSSAPPSFYAYRYSVTVSGNTTFDIDLPVVKVSGTVTDPGGQPLPNATVQLDTNSWAPNASQNSNGTTTTNASGFYEILGFAAGANGGSATLTVRPPSGVEAATMSESGIVLAGDLTKDVALAAPTFLSGTVRGYGGAAVAGASVSVYTPNWQAIASTTTDAAGKYSVSLGSGSVILYVQAPWPPSGGSAPPSFYAYRYSVTVSGDTTFDIDLPVVKISGTVTDSNGAPVPGVTLQLDSNSWAPNASQNSNATTTTSAGGAYEILGFAAGSNGGAANLTVRPPASSGFSTAALSGLALSADLTQRIILQRPDLSPPQIVAGPVVVHLSDTSVSISWTTNEAATSIVQFGIGGLTLAVTDAEPVTNHEITLLDLAPLSTYTFRVGSRDAAGNGPTFSATGTFNTQGAPGDITAPVISDGPTVVFIDQTTAIVEWTTDEPSSSVVEYGLDASLGSTIDGDPGRFRQVHRVKLIGLTADTEYRARVKSADPDGNAAASSVFTFRTLAAPDTAAPVITEGPAVVSKTDSKIVIAWTTNEPATSGVSYNDGIHFDLASDTTLTRAHQMTLSGLLASTTYHVTVSSIDAVGNGPTLSSVLDVTTDATPDTAAPVVTNLRVIDITTKDAVIVWTTDEPANSAVDYGTASGAPDSVKAGVASVTEHRLTLTGLQDGTTYYLRVSSTDGSGNTGTSDEISFKTESAFVDMPPSAPGPITAPVSPTRAATFSLSWGASTDDVALVGYAVLRDGEIIATVDPDTTSIDETDVAEGSHTYQVRATDSAGHHAVSAILTLVIDRTAPLLSVPVGVQADAIGTHATVAFGALATDNVDGEVPVGCSAASGSSFPIGTTEVTCTAADAAGNRTTKSFDVVVRDTTAPVIELFEPSQSLVWPPNHQMVSLTLRVRATDAGDATPVCEITAIRSNESADGAGDGSTKLDWAFSGLSFSIRAERSAQGSGRIYTIDGSCRDASGNVTTRSTTVSVPLNMSKK